MNLYPHLQPQPDDLAYFAAGPCDDEVKQRIVVERAIVRSACTALLAAGLLISVHDGEDTPLKKSSDLGAIMEAIQSTDEDALLVYEANGDRMGTVSLVYGNDGHDLIADSSSNLDDLLLGTSKLADELCERMTGA